MIDKQSHQKTHEQTRAKQSKIQKLLLKGYINEEQFICLQLLEKGYIPASPGEFMQVQHGGSSGKQRHYEESNNSSARHRRNQRFASATLAPGG